MNDNQLKIVHGVATEQHETKKQQQEVTYQGSVILHPGQKLWSFNMTTGELNQVEIEREKTVSFIDKNKIQRKNLNTHPDCLYVPALNKKTAMKKVLKQFGMNVTKSGKVLTKAKVERVTEVIELNKPEENEQQPQHGPEQQ